MSLHRCLGRISHSPFGRGVKFLGTQFWDTYVRFGEVSLHGQYPGGFTDPDWDADELGSGLYPGNFSLNAGIPEDVILFGNSAYNVDAHRHATARLAPESVGYPQFNARGPHSGDVVFTQVPRTIMLAGRSKRYRFTPGQPIHDFVPFKDTSVQLSEFPLAVGRVHVFPGVLVAGTSAAGSPGELLGVVVRSTSSTGFAFSLGNVPNSAYTGGSVQIMYIAIANDSGYYTNQDRKSVV